MSTNIEKLTQAGIVGTTHLISPEDEASIGTLSDSEVDALIAIKAKLSAVSPEDHAKTGSLSPVGTVSF